MDGNRIFTRVQMQNARNAAEAGRGQRSADALPAGQWWTVFRMQYAYPNSPEGFTLSVQQRMHAGAIVLVEGEPEFRVFVHGGCFPDGDGEKRFRDVRAALDCCSELLCKSWEEDDLE